MAKEKYLIIRDREHMLTPFSWMGLVVIVEKNKKIYKIKKKTCWSLIKNGRAKSMFLKDDFEKVGGYIADAMFKDIKYFSCIKEEVAKVDKGAEKFLSNIKKVKFHQLNFEELIQLVDKIKREYINYNVANDQVRLNGGDKFDKMVSGHLNISRDDFLILTTPTVKTFVSQLEYDLLKYTKLIKNGEKNSEKIAQKLSEDYGWIPFGYDGLEYWDRAYFTRILKQHHKKHSKNINNKINKIEFNDKNNLRRRNKIVKKYKLTKKQLRLINIINILNIWTDQRKKVASKFHYYYSNIILELEKRYNIPYKNLKYLFSEELTDVKDSRDKILKISNYRIDNEFMLEFKNDKIRIISNKQKDKILKELKNQTEQSNITGMVASRGINNIYQGIVKVLLSPKEGSKIKRGDFLIATMTGPDYIVSMKKAAGFITDEGGITCHAAIVVREMKKPCIIGTKIATKVLKDGDLVEVDADKGVVKILKRKNEKDKN